MTLQPAGHETVREAVFSGRRGQKEARSGGIHCGSADTDTARMQARISPLPLVAAQVGTRRNLRPALRSSLRPLSSLSAYRALSLAALLPAQAFMAFTPSRCTSLRSSLSAPAESSPCSDFA